MVTGNFLTPGETDIIEQAKEKKKLKKERKKLAKAKKEFKADTIGRRVKKAFFTKQTIGKPPKKKIFGTRPVQEDFTREQNILRGMFGHGGRVMTNTDGRSLPRINNVLNSGGGILKSGDEGETRDLFKGGQALPFFGGRRRY